VYLARRFYLPELFPIFTRAKLGLLSEFRGHGYNPTAGWISLLVISDVLMRILVPCWTDPGSYYPWIPVGAIVRVLG